MLLCSAEGFPSMTWQPCSMCHHRSCWRPVDELIHADLLTECDGRLIFGHDLILEAVRASIPVPVRRSLERQAASVLLAAGSAPGGGRHAAVRER